MDGYWCVSYHDIPRWVYGVKGIVALFIIAGNVVVLMAIARNWKRLMRQHNLYRYLLSLVVADLLNGLILLLHAIFWLVHMLMFGGVQGFNSENFQEVLRNLISGSLHGLAFASLASATLLNLVMRVTSIRAVARAAAITDRSKISLSWARNPRISFVLTSLIWVIALAFTIIPLRYHCHMNLQQCLSKNTSYNSTLMVFSENKLLDPVENPESYDCSVLRPPSRRTYLLALSGLIAIAWLLLFVCNFITACIRTTVDRVIDCTTNSGNLRLRHSFGFQRDTSSIFAFVITLNMTISTVPYVVFGFVTEAGSDYLRIYYGDFFSGNAVEFFEIVTYLSSLVNPLIYTAMLNQLRSNVDRTIGVMLKSLHRSQRKKLRRSFREEK
ncbi:unnamed protein product [Clavelina lepadiformis]|uniref:G-protein coupled receptors family 1 profile domain-containing protein n=1 Tax=Clavelina lepadiformis TaxID=159417 RepID=A0ABP0FTE2_CLALP